MDPRQYGLIKEYTAKKMADQEANVETISETEGQAV
jgi:hypothetical protein